MTEQMTRIERLAREPAVALANLLETDVPTAELPPLWHLVYFIEWPHQSDLGPDGHAYHGLPPSPGSGWRRMFAGGRVDTHGLLRFDDPATRTSAIVSTTEKAGRSGPLRFVTVRHEYAQAGEGVLVVEDDVVYRPAVASSLSAHTADPVPGGDTLLTIDVEPTTLFRFSALTYNAHRIHYDRGWCAHEGYAGLVVHGPLQVLLMAEALRRDGVSLVGNRLSYRLVSPLVGEQRISVRRRSSDEGLEVVGEAGVVTATASASAL